MKLTDKQQHDYLAAILLEVRALRDQVKKLENDIKDLKKTGEEEDQHQPERDCLVGRFHNARSLHQSSSERLKSE